MILLGRRAPRPLRTPWTDDGERAGGKGGRAGAGQGTGEWTANSSSEERSSSVAHVPQIHVEDPTILIRLPPSLLSSLHYSAVLD